MSQQNISVLTLTLVASGAVAESRIVGFDSAQATTQGQKVMGPSIAQAASGEAFGVVAQGTAIVETGAAITIGDSLITDSDGRAIPVTGGLTVATGAVAVTSSAANGAILAGADLPEYVFADALQTAAAAGEFIEVLMRR